MARRKNLPDVVRVKCSLSERLREIRVEVFGERGGSEMARRLGIPVRTWYNYESGVTVPAEVLLRFLELTGVEPAWLLHGTGPRFRPRTAAAEPGSSITSLLRTALHKLESDGASARRPRPTLDGVPESATLDPGSNTDTLCLAESDPGYASWLEASEEGRIVQVNDGAMVPIVAEGARVAYAAEPEPLEALDDALVVAWVDGTPLVRWFRRSGGFGLLRAEHPDFTPSTHLVDLRSGDDARRIRRVLWISTPH
jgi:hypothetical protein